MPTGTAKSVMDEAKTALQGLRKAIPGAIVAPKVTSGIPGAVGGLLKFAGPVGAALSAVSLGASVKTGDHAAIARDVAGTAAGTLETVALASSYIGGGTAAGAAGTVASGGAAATIGGGAAIAAPVLGAAALGLTVGIVVENSLNVSEYSAAHGTAAYETLKSAGVNDTAAFVAGGVVTALSTPLALAEASAHKAWGWLSH